MYEVTESGTRLEQLKNLALILAKLIDSGDEDHSMAQLVRQYRETLKEIAELEDEDDGGDEIAGIIAFSANATRAAAAN
jgi:hypothetical protein